MPRMDKVQLLANYFGVLKSDLIEEKEKPTTKGDELPDDVKTLIQDAVSLNPKNREVAKRILSALVAAQSDETS